MLTLLTRRCASFNVLSRFFSLAVTIAATLLLIGLAAAPTRVHAAQSYDNCTGFITSLPATITTQGTWCLNADLTTAITSGNAITVAANNVTIDCNDFKLGGLAAGAGTQAYGISADTRDNLTIRRCNIRGFRFGTYLVNGSGHLIEDSRFDSNTYLSIGVASNRSIIRRNLVIATGGSSFIGPSVGIVSYGSVDVLDNTVNGVTATGTNNNAFGIQTFNNPDGRISGNSVRGVVKVGTGITYGIYNSGSGRITLRNNDVVGDGSTGSTGLYCNTAQGRATGNVVGGFATTINTCSGTNNEIVP
jgi:nitrous oxidase accessory protein NosD